MAIFIFSVLFLKEISWLVFAYKTRCWLYSSSNNDNTKNANSYCVLYWIRIHAKTFTYVYYFI